jgi:hypothetical protein
LTTTDTSVDSDVSRRDACLCSTSTRRHLTTGRLSLLELEQGALLGGFHKGRATIERRQALATPLLASHDAAQHLPLEQLEALGDLRTQLLVRWFFDGSWWWLLLL